jgi:hypothetical protein
MVIAEKEFPTFWYKFTPTWLPAKDLFTDFHSTNLIPPYGIDGANSLRNIIRHLERSTNTNYHAGHRFVVFSPETQ